MDPQLNAVIEDLRSAEHRLRTLRSTLPSDAWSRRPGITRWSPAECVAHLNLTSESLLPLLRAGLEEAGDGRHQAESRYRRDPVGWLIWKVTTPSGRWRTRTVPAFVPSVEIPPEALVADFERLQADVIACVRCRGSSDRSRQGGVAVRRSCEIQPLRRLHDHSPPPAPASPAGRARRRRARAGSVSVRRVEDTSARFAPPPSSESS